MKRSIWTIALSVLAVALWANVAGADDKKEAKTVSGKSACATCEGLPVEGHAIMLIDKEGTRWVLMGEGDDYKAAHKVRKDSKNMKATLAGKPETKKDEDGKEFYVVKISKIEIVES